MSAGLLSGAILLAMLMVAAAMGCAAWRVLRGPRAQDRVLALDTLYVNGAVMLLLFGIRSGSLVYFEVALLIALLGFVSTVALSKFLLRGEVIE
jgi:multicomponent K+:H+ antiporter subunit F